MKKLLGVLSVVAVAGMISTASATDRTGKIGLGYQETFTSVFGSSSLGSWSVKYGVSSNVTANFVVGFDMTNKNGDKSIDFGGRVLYDLMQKENSDLYTGIGVGWAQDKVSAGGADNRALLIQFPLGFEFSFAGLPEVGFSAEAGVVLGYQKASKAWSFNSQGGTVGGALGLGVHYYF